MGAGVGTEAAEGLGVFAFCALAGAGTSGKLTVQFLVAHESRGSLQQKGQEAAAAGHQIWVFVGPGRALVRLGDQWHPQHLLIPHAKGVEGPPMGTGPREWRGSHWDCPGAGTSFREKGPCPGASRIRAFGVGFTSMARPGIDSSRSVLAAGAGSTRWGMQLVSWQDIGRGLHGLAHGGRVGQERSDRVLR